MNQTTNAGIDLDKVLNQAGTTARLGSENHCRDLLLEIEKLDLARRAEPSVAADERALFGFDRDDLEAIADGLETGYEKGVDVGGSPLDGNGANLIESTTAAAARFIRAALASPAVSQKDGAAVECGECNDSGIVGFPPDQYEDCPGCIKARAASSQFANSEHTAATTASASDAECRKTCNICWGEGGDPWPCAREKVKGRATAPSRDARVTFEALFATIHPAAKHTATLFARVVDDSRYCSLEVEYAWRTYQEARAPLPAKGDERRTLAPLTNERIIEIADSTRTAESRDGDYILPISFARAIEAALEESAPTASHDTQGEKNV